MDDKRKEVKESTRLARVAKLHKLSIGPADSTIGLAIEVAMEAHEGQLRRPEGQEQEPYINHPIRVAQTVHGVFPDVYCIVAALLHDTVEDTPVTFDDIRELFGGFVTELVDGLTNASTGLPTAAQIGGYNRAARHQMDMEKLREAHHYAKLVKLADLIDNSISIREHDPDFWKVYGPEKIDILQYSLQPPMSRSYSFDKAYRTLYDEAKRQVGLE